MVAHAAVARLHLVGDEEASGGVGLLDDHGHFVRGRGADAVAREGSVDERRGELNAAAVQTLERRLHAVSTGPRRGDRLDVRRPVTGGPFLGREIRDRGRDAVVGVLGHDSAPAAGRCEREPPRQLVRLAA